MALDDLSQHPPRERGIFCNRTLNLRSIRAVGYDMDYTLIHYNHEAWERRAFEHLQSRLVAQGFPVEGLTFDPGLVIRGLILDTELGNLLKVNRFGYVKRASHGTRPLDFETQRRTYSRVIVDLAEERFVFLNTLFSISEAAMYANLVDLLDERKLPEVLGYSDLHKKVRVALDATHVEGQLKQEIMAEPERFVVLDPDAPQALLDQRDAGKKLMLITNSEWFYTNAMMSYAYDPFLKGKTWKDLFDVVVVQARKPEFFSGRSPLFEIVSADGLLRPWPHAIQEGRTYFGGNALLLEQYLGLSGDEILYVGDHIYVDVHVSKSVLRWRTALIVRELEEEIVAMLEAKVDEAKLANLMSEKNELEFLQCRYKLELQRLRASSGQADNASEEEELSKKLSEVRAMLLLLDERIAPLAKAASEVGNPHWGPLMRAGNDKSHLARQVERSADVYTSRVSNFLYQTPFMFFRSPRGTLPHDLDEHLQAHAETISSTIL